MVERYEDKAFFFFSYEQTRKQIGLWVLNILSGCVLNENRKEQNLDFLEAYLRGGGTGKPSIETGKERFRGFKKDKRVWLIDEPYFVDDLTDTLAYLSERHNVGAVFIDYIQKVKVRGGYQSRQVEIQKVSERILESAKSLSFPVVLGAQLGRPSKVQSYKMENIVRIDNIREAGDIEQDANLMLGLWNEYKAKEERDKKDNSIERVANDPIELTVKILKNRGGATGDKISLDFNRPVLTITDQRKETRGRK